MMSKQPGATLDFILLAAISVRTENSTVLGEMGAEIRAAGIPARIVGRTVK